LANLITAPDFRTVGRIANCGQRPHKLKGRGLPGAVWRGQTVLNETAPGGAGETVFLGQGAKFASRLGAKENPLADFLSRLGGNDGRGAEGSGNGGHCVVLLSAGIRPARFRSSDRRGPTVTRKVKSARRAMHGERRVKRATRAWVCCCPEAVNSGLGACSPSGQSFDLAKVQLRPVSQQRVAFTPPFPVGNCRTCGCRFLSLGLFPACPYVGAGNSGGLPDTFRFHRGELKERCQ
jgi:hypothetical protein